MDPIDRLGRVTSLAYLNPIFVLLKRPHHFLYPADSWKPLWENIVKAGKGEICENETPRIVFPISWGLLRWTHRVTNFSSYFCLVWWLEFHQKKKKSGFQPWVLRILSLQRQYFCYNKISQIMMKMPSSFLWLKL